MWVVCVVLSAEDAPHVRRPQRAGASLSGRNRSGLLYSVWTVFQDVPGLRDPGGQRRCQKLRKKTRRRKPPECKTVIPYLEPKVRYIIAGGETPGKRGSSLLLSPERAR